MPRYLCWSPNRRGREIPEGKRYAEKMWGHLRASVEKSWAWPSQRLLLLFISSRAKSKGSPEPLLSPQW